MNLPNRFYLLFSSLALTVSAQAQSPVWHSVSSGTTLMLNSVHFTSSTTGYAVGESSTILKTINGGDTWNNSWNSRAGSLSSVYFPTMDTGYAVGGGCSTGPVMYCYGLVYKTVNGGLNWASQEIQYVRFRLERITCVSTQICWAAGSGLASDGLHPSGGIIKTTDGGVNWTISGNGAYGSIHFPSASVGFVTRFSDFPVPIGKTVDGGSTWSNLSMTGMNSLFFTSVDIGFAVGAIDRYGTFSRIKKTINGGVDWITQDSVNLKLKSIFCISISSCWTVGDSGTIRNTSNGGTTWTSQTSHSLANLTSVHFPTPDIGYAVGAGGTILKYGVPTALSKGRRSGKNFEIQKKRILQPFLHGTKSDQILLFDLRGKMILTSKNPL